MHDHEDRCDELEVELKFCPVGPANQTVDEITSLLQGKYGFIKWPPMVQFDIYLDTRNFALYRTNSSLRLRRWGTPFEHKGPRSNFKYPPDIRQGLRRRELKAPLSDDESRLICNGAIISTPVRHAADFIRTMEGSDPVFTPKVLLGNHNSTYVLRPRDEAAAESRRRTGSAPPPQHGKSSNLLILQFDNYTVQAVPDGAINRLIRNGFVDYDSEATTADFFEAEIEIVASPDLLEQAGELYDRIFQALQRSGTEMPLRSKYSRAVDALGMDQSHDQDIREILGARLSP